MLWASSRASPSAPAVVAVAGGHGVQEALRRAVSAGRGVRAGREQAAVVVRPAYERLAPGGVAVGLDAVALGHGPQLLRRERLDDRPQKPVAAAGAGAVAALEHVEQEQHALHRLGRQPPGHVEERVGDVVGDVRLTQAGDEVVHAWAGLGGLGERGLVDAERHHVDARPFLREPGVELRAQEGPRQVGDGQGPGQRVVVGDGDEVHSPGALRPVQVEGFGEGLRLAQEAEPGAARRVGVPGVDVEVGSGQWGHNPTIPPASGLRRRRLCLSPGMPVLSAHGRPSPRRAHGRGRRPPRPGRRGHALHHRARRQPRGQPHGQPPRPVRDDDAGRRQRSSR